MSKKRMLVAGCLIVVLLSTLVVISPVPTQAQQQNLLANPGFEPPYEGGVASYWQPWYEDSGELCETRPDDWDFVCKPVWSQEIDPNNYGLTRGGSSQHVGVQYVPWHAGVYQTVEVEPGTRVRFTVFGYSFASNDDLPAASFGGNWVARMRVGIDPEGRGQWYAGGIVWTGENNAMDSWQQMSVEATAGQSGKVTVFVASKYSNATPLKHMDSWWDNATLEVVQPAATPTFTPQPTSAVPPTPVNTPTPRPDGAVVHVVQSGDTLYGIALQYDVDIDELRRLNAGTLGPNDMLSVGQELIISAPSATPTATPAPTQAATPEPTEEPGGEDEAPAEAGGVGSICVSAYHDRNEDMVRQPGEEELLPNATFTLVGTDGPAGSYTSDGISEPYCFEGLTPGSYILRQTPPAGYAPTGPGEWGVPLSAGQTASLNLGYLRTTGATSPQETQAPTEPTETADDGTGAGGSVNNVLNLVLRISGIVVLVLALLVAGLFVISRRR